MKSVTIGVMVFNFAFVFLSWMGAILVDDLRVIADHPILFKWPVFESESVLEYLVTWDVAHYLFLADSGYGPGVPSCAFFPLWPFVLRGISQVSGLSTIHCAWILPAVFSGLAFVLSYSHVRRMFGDEVGRKSLILYLTWPFGVFFHFGYSESLFLLLSVGLWVGLKEKQFRLIYFCGFLLPLTRAVGMFCVLPIIAEWLFGAKSVCRRRERAYLFAACFPVAGYVTYLLLMREMTGDPFIGYAAQSSWGAHSIQNLFAPWNFVNNFVSPRAWHAFDGSLVDRLSFGLWCACLFQASKMGNRMWIWLLSYGFVPALSGGFVSYSRFLIVVFPVFVCLGSITKDLLKRDSMFTALAIGMLIVKFCLTVRFMSFRWVG